MINREPSIAKADPASVRQMDMVMNGRTEFEIRGGLTRRKVTTVTPAP